MNQAAGGRSNNDRSELFVIGAAAGALVATIVQEIVAQRRQTPLERVQARAQARVDELSKIGGGYLRGLQEGTADYLTLLGKQSNRKWKKTRKTATKQAKRARKQAGKRGNNTVIAAVSDTIGAAANVLGTAKPPKKTSSWFSRAADTVQAVTGVAPNTPTDTNVSKKARKLFSSATGTVTDTKVPKKARKLFSSATDTAKEYVETARERIQDADITGSSSNGNVATDLLKTASTVVAARLGTARDAVADAVVTDRARDYASTVAETVKDYAGTARERLQEANLQEKARDYASVARDTVKDYADTARERLQDVNLGEKARDYASVAVDTAKEVATTARERLEEANLPEKAREYAEVVAERGKAGAKTLGTTATKVAEATSEGAKEARKEVQQGVKHTRRRVRWGLRAFLIGLAVGVLTAPQSGERTRNTVQQFLESILDIVAPEAGPSKPAF